jgi:hypothetical protein
VVLVVGQREVVVVLVALEQEHRYPLQLAQNIRLL